MKYTMNEFRKQYPNDDVYLDAIFKMKYEAMPCCPQCQQQTTFTKIDGRKCYQCGDKDCQYQLSPTAGTVFEKTRTPLTDWFYIIYLMTSTRNADRITVGDKHTNTVEDFFSQLKRTIGGTHIHVSKQHLQKYVNECCFRYTYRRQGQDMFKTILSRVVAS